MSSVLEKLVDAWLDNQGERRYQAALIQLLISEGWTVLHNTRHSPLEFGKDVIARNPSGELCALQLKGNPGTRLTKSQAQSMLPQIIELLEVPVPVSYGSLDERHISIIVTNGEIDEEARVLFEELGRRCEKPNAVSSRLELWSRGTLLARFRSKLNIVWPTTIEGTRAILELHGADGHAIPCHEQISKVLNAAVGRPSKEMKEPERFSRLSSLLLLGEIIKYPWQITENHFALFQITVLVSIFGLRYCDVADRLNAISSYADVALDHCADLLNEAESVSFDPKLIWSSGDMFAEIDFMRERVRLVANAASALILSGRSGSFSRPYATSLIRESFGSGLLWGHSAVPPALLRYWAFCRVDATKAPDFLLGHVLSGLLAVADRKSGLTLNGLPAPYYSFDECLFLHSAGQVGEESRVVNDSTRGRAWFARAILYMLAKRNWKQSCKQIWPQFSKTLHEEANLSKDDFFDSNISNNGSYDTLQFYAKEWRDLVKEATNEDSFYFLEGFEELAWLIASYISIVPYRAWTPVILWLDLQIGNAWYTKDHLPPA